MAAIRNCFIATIAVLLCGVMFALPNGTQAHAQATGPTTNTSEGIIIAQPAVAVRAGPSKTTRRIGILRHGTKVQLLERSPRGLWVRISSGSGIAGWVARRHINTNDLSMPLPVAEPAAEPAAEAAAEAVPVVPDVVRTPLRTGTRSRAIFARGQALGNRSNVFSVIGDSLTSAQPFMRGFGDGGYALGSHGYLQETINHFSAPPREGVANSFMHQSKAATIAFNAAAALDPTWLAWTDKSGQCASDESPVACEYRINKPSVAVILLGPEDLQIYDVNTFQIHLSRVIKISVDSGVIPVLTTFPTAPNNAALQNGALFNDAIRNMAATYGVPVIDMRDAALALPAAGVKEDGFHLSDFGSAYGFNVDNSQISGCALRNLYTLQMLDLLRRNVLTR